MARGRKKCGILAFGLSKKGHSLYVTKLAYVNTQLDRFDNFFLKWLQGLSMQFFAVRTETSTLMFRDSGQKTRLLNYLVDEPENPSGKVIMQGSSFWMKLVLAWLT